MELTDKICLIVGATGAIGHAVAESFHREGARAFHSQRKRHREDLPPTDLESCGSFNGNRKEVRMSRRQDRSFSQSILGVLGLIATYELQPRVGYKTGNQSGGSFHLVQAVLLSSGRWLRQDHPPRRRSVRSPFYSVQCFKGGLSTIYGELAAELRIK
jgi:NAD(P)-dependent dehydrogenase (short-subunit alcohol dehydrogenase family)